MEHSLEKYLERQSTQKLECVLREYLTMDNAENYKDAIQMIRKVLEERKVYSCGNSPPDCCIGSVRFRLGSTIKNSRPEGRHFLWWSIRN